MVSQVSAPGFLRRHGQQNERISEFILIVGLSGFFLWIGVVWFHSGIIPSGFMRFVQNASLAANSRDPICFVAFLTAAGISVAIIRYYAFFERFIFSNTFILTIWILAALITALPLLTPSGKIYFLVSIGFCMGVVCAFLFCIWGPLCSSLPFHRSLFVVTVSLAVSEVLYLLMQATQGLVLCVLALLVISASLICILISPKPHNSFEDLSGSLHRSSIRRLLLSVTLLGFLSALLQGIFFDKQPETASGLLSVLIPLLSIVVFSIAPIAIYLLMKRSNRIRVGLYYRYLFLITIISLVTIILPALRPLVSATVISLSGITMFVVFFSFALLLSFYQSFNSIKTFARLACFWYIGMFLSIPAKSITESLWGSAGDLTLYLGAFGVLMASVACLYLFTESDIETLSPEQLSVANDLFQEACQQLAVIHRLSQREAEIMELLARGRNATYIQQRLFISYSTVSSHRQNIYRKLGVHTHQELMSLVEKGAP
jgi:DNA-binding CsgD family transcriptional regulator